MILFLSFLLASCEANEPVINFVYDPPSYDDSYLPGGDVNHPNNQVSSGFNQVFREKVADPIREKTKWASANVEGYKEKTDKYTKRIENLKSERTQPNVVKNKMPSLDEIINKQKRINPNSLEDLPLDYTFISHEDDLERIYKDLYKINPRFEREQLAKQIGLESVKEADASFANDQIQDGYIFKQIAKDLLDIAVGIDPLTNWGRSAYELFTGKNMITGEELCNVDQGLNAASILSLGTAGAGSKLLRIGAKFAKFEKLSHAIKKAKGFLKNIPSEDVFQGKTMAERDKELMDLISKSNKPKEDHIWVHPITGQKWDKRTSEIVEWFE